MLNKLDILKLFTTYSKALYQLVLIETKAIAVIIQLQEVLIGKFTISITSYHSNHKLSNEH